MGNYYYLIAGLPELQFEIEKLQLSLNDFKIELDENLTPVDRQLIDLFFMPYDNANLLKLLINPEAEISMLGNLSREELLEIILQFKESDEPNDPLISNYLKRFLPAYLADRTIYPGMSWEDHLASLFYDDAIACKNNFFSEWYHFNLNITNLLTAVNCMKYGYEREQAIVGSSEIAEAIRTSNSKDFGIAAIFPEVDELLHLAEVEDILERERKIDLIKWQWLEEKVVDHYFDVEHLFVYLIRLELLERWTRLEKETGLKVFRKMIGSLQQAFEFSDEFTVKKVK
jgi:hypothetical protein